MLQPGKIEKEAASEGMQAALRSWTRPRDGFSPTAYRRNAAPRTP